jgi:hypothetical protein
MLMAERFERHKTIGGIMRNFCMAAVAANLLFASVAQGQPLAPGKPAGVRAARLHAGTGLLIVGSLLAAGLVVALANSGGNNTTGLIVPTAGTGTTS